MPTGQYHTLALCTDGTLVAWGDNADGKLGDHSTTSRSDQAAVDCAEGIRLVGMASGAAARHNLALVALSAGQSPRGAVIGNAGLPAAEVNPEGVADLLKEAFGLNGDSGPGRLPQAQRIGDELVICFTQPTTATDLVYGAEWSPDLLPGTWQDVPDTGSGGDHRFAIPAAGRSQAFLRLKVTRR